MRVALIAIGLSALGGFGGLSVAAMLCLFPDAIRRRVVPALVSYAVGALLGVALLDLLPEASAVLGTRGALATALAGIVTFFALEKLALWRHGQAEVAEYRPTAQLVLIGDSAHNFMDGALIGAAALVSVPSASFVYVAMADLIPEMHRGSIHLAAPWQVALIGAGALTVAVL